MRRAMLVGAAALLLATPMVRADLLPRPGPGPRPGAGQQGQPPKTNVNIVVDEKATEPRVIIPLKVLLGGGGAGFGGFGGAIGGPPGGQIGAPPGGQFGVGGGAIGGPPPGSKPPQGGGKPPQDEEESTEPEKRSSLPFSTVIVGMALALSLSTGGLWMVRRKSDKPGGGVTPLLVLVAVTAMAVIGTATVSANRAPPPRPPQPPKVNLPGPLPALLKMEGVRFDIDPQGDTVRIILTKKKMEELQKAVPGKVN